MNPAQLEWARLWRTRRLLALLFVFTFFGFLGPVLAAYLPELLGAATGTDDIVIEVPDPVPADGLAQYVGNVGQLGVLVVAVVAALALSMNGRPGLAAFYRSRQVSGVARVLPRWAATTLAAALAWTLGLLAAVYETLVLLGGLPVQAVLVGWAAWIGYLGFAVAVVAALAGVLTSTVSTAAAGVGALLAVGVLGLIPQIEEWTPAYLIGAPEALAREVTTAGDYAVSAAVTVLVTAALLLVAVRTVDAREL